MKIGSSSQVKRIVADLKRFAYNDKANILQDTVNSLGTLGQPSVTTTSTEVVCSYTDVRGARAMERWLNYVDVEQLVGELRYFGDPTPVKGNRVTVTSRFGDADFADITYEVIGIQDRGSFGWLLALAKVGI